MIRVRSDARARVTTDVARNPRTASHDRIRVFHLIKGLGRGGAETLLHSTLLVGDRDRFEYQIGYFLPWKDALVESLRSEGAPVTCFPARSNATILLSARRIARHLGDHRVDLLHCHLPIAGVVGRWAGRLAGVPVVYTEHNKMELYHPLTRRLNLATWGMQQRAIAVSEGVAESVRKHAKPGVPVDVVLNGVDVRHFDRRLMDATPLRRKLGIPERAPVVGTVAVFRAQKRLDHWLEVAKIVKSANPDAHFLIVGDGPLRAELLARGNSLDLGDSLHWTGLQSDVRPYLAAMDVYLMSSAVEGLPIALLEAMSMGCGVVTTAVGGIPELVEDGRSGLLLPAGRLDLLALAVNRLLREPDLLREQAAAARRTVDSRFSVQRMARQLESVYRDVALGKRNDR